MYRVSTGLKGSHNSVSQQRKLAEAEQEREFSLVAIMDEKAKWLIAGALAVSAGVALYSVVGRVSSKSQDGTGKSWFSGIMNPSTSEPRESRTPREARTPRESRTPREPREPRTPRTPRTS